MPLLKKQHLRTELPYIAVLNKKDIMKTVNELLFENLETEGYWTTTEAAKGRFKELTKYPDSLGYDVVTDGYLALHKGHQPGGIADEIQACLILKQKGYGVCLLDESSSTGIEPDVAVNSKIYDIKRVYQTENLINRLSKLFKKVGKMGIDKIVLHIDQAVEMPYLVSVLAETAARRSNVSEVILIVRHTIYELTRVQMLQRNWYQIDK
jgi:hypothetical protein